ncbi:MAG: acyl-CoA thioesterase [Desulfurococcales archaeon]|nr:acyl-CoA thioesterase [Desulfurococcales archaeon]
MKHGDIFSMKWRVWWSETDAAGIMHFSRYFAICERLEEEFYFHIGIGEKARMAGRKIWFPRVHAECDYKKPLLPRTTYEVALTKIEMGESSIAYYYEFRNDSGETIANCNIVTVSVTGFPPKKIPIPLELREILKAHGAVDRDSS